MKTPPAGPRTAGASIPSPALRAGSHRVLRAFLPFLLLAGLSVASPAGRASDALPAASIASSPAALPPGARISERIVGLPGLPNAGRIAPGIFRGAQPTPQGYATLRAMGIRTVINLRTRRSERRAVETEGMRSLEIPLRVTGEVDAAAVRRAVQAMRDPENRPVFVHCALGKDRTGVVAAVYRMDVDGWSVEEAVAEMTSYGFNAVWKNLMAFVKGYPSAGRTADARKGGGP